METIKKIIMAKQTLYFVIAVCWSFLILEVARKNHVATACLLLVLLGYYIILNRKIEFIKNVILAQKELIECLYTEIQILKKERKFDD